jgi:hypothetical protein
MQQNASKIFSPTRHGGPTRLRRASPKTVMAGNQRNQLPGHGLIVCVKLQGNEVPAAAMAENRLQRQAWRITVSCIGSIGTGIERVFRLYMQ